MTGRRTDRPGEESVLFPAFSACPGCSGPVRGESIADLTVLICVICGRAWHVELGVVYLVEEQA